MHSAKIAIEPYVHGVCVHFADLRLGTSELAIEPYVRWVCEQFEHVSKVAKKYVQIPIRRASSSGGTPYRFWGIFAVFSGICGFVEVIPGFVKLS